MALVGADGRALDELASIVGAEHARLAQADDTIDGVAARLVVAPGSVTEASRVLRLAHERDLAVAPRGAGTMLGWGNPPHRVDIIVETRRLNRILEHAAGDLVARVEAGVTLGQLQQTLAAAGQFLALDPPPLRLASGDWAPDTRTLGGIIAANASGPRRLRYGAVRDLLIGITVVLADGTVAKAGGKVVKNVAGYDLCKLYTGSYGTLGLIVEAIFRLHPLPPARRIVTVDLSDVEAAGAAMQDILHAPLVPSALELAWSDGRGMLLALFEGVEAGAVAQAEQTMALWGSHGAAHLVAPPEADELWRIVTTEPWHDDAGAIGLSIGSVPADLPYVLNLVTDEAARVGASTRLAGRAGSGVTLAALAGIDLAAAPGMVESLRRQLELHGAHVMVRRAPPAIRRPINTWGEVGDALPLMRRVKEQFDPAGIMNPGRFVGGI